ncbi:RelA/SpoT domain-containing protein [Zavarzinia compransoris]|uniref:(P)ppGpp synthetase n=1 Tax=Zavarzinia compransoris TaxID=1264899 RepID=A0A317E0R6_9PROT|nr:RelA/SpoT domain-containing protein [Zavarzinia compransoris]PWR18745.1 (p)ppGpp synthetase [Zavarzinia compransoris]TDP48728.1 RelA/SpoT family protein [Zavarzinia compransoris]
MVWATLEYSPEQVNSAGKKLAGLIFPVITSEGVNVLSIINNWRSAHAFPLNTFQMTLRNKAKKIEREIIVAQRIKRLESIHRKLTQKNSMRMTQMQDIAGCRVVFKEKGSVYSLVEEYKNTGFSHAFKGEKDYILNPKADGYRSYHLIFQYKGRGVNMKYDNLKIEIQIRTQPQHAWATAVEAVGLFTRQALKSNQGNQDWLRFFALMGTAISIIENCNPVPGTPDNRRELVREIESLSKRLNVSNVLQMYNSTIEFIGGAKDSKYFLLDLDPNAGTIKIRRFKAKESAEANRFYTDLEGSISDNSPNQIVLVSVENINSLKRAYPNYFMDTDIFSKIVANIRRGDFSMPTPQ